MKSYFDEILRNFVGLQWGTNSSNDPTNFQREKTIFGQFFGSMEPLDEEIEKEESSFQKGNYTTKVTTFFSKEGFAIRTMTESTELKTNQAKLEDLRKKLQDAIAGEDYMLAAQLKEEITKLEQ